ncbi:DUF2293 domain-containing protein [Actinoplanes sp. NPDC051851]|uniref:DUF2293 domain-containing protein n=1 Tax=Actinoplanes sp. NPDC051851 TaxID=3154753 RepID=UPI003442B07F
MQPTSKLERRVVTAAENALAQRRYVSPIDVLVGIGWLPPGPVTAWERGLTPHLEPAAVVDPDRLAGALDILRRWALGNGMRSTEVSYAAATRDRHPLRFTVDGRPERELAYRTHWMPADLTDAQRDRLTAKQNTPPDMIVLLAARSFTCAGCGETEADMLMMEEGEPLCLACTDLDHLVFLPAGDAALTRRAKKASRLSAVVVRFNRSRKRNERQGLLVEESALAEAEQQCLSDEEARARRRDRDRERREAADVVFQENLATLIADLFPAIPASRAMEISLHTALRGSGRVGRSAAGRALDPDAATRAVIASIRHEDTDYDTLLMSGVPRPEARDRIRPTIDRILTAWRRPA